MAFETEFDGQTDFSDFLERFRMQEIPASDGASAKSSYDGKKQLNAVSRQASMINLLKNWKPKYTSWKNALKPLPPKMTKF